jgi:hypothetical protein
LGFIKRKAHHACNGGNKKTKGEKKIKKSLAYRSSMGKHPLKKKRILVFISWCLF